MKTLRNKPRKRRYQKPSQASFKPISMSFSGGEKRRNASAFKRNGEKNWRRKKENSEQRVWCVSF